MIGRVLVLGLIGIAIIGAAGFGLMYGLDRWRGTRPQSAAAVAESTVAGNAAVPDSTTADDRAPDARRDSSSPGADTSAGTAPIHLPHPEVLVGTWSHGDRRSKYGDSLVLVLEGNGSARARERRWTLDAAGWHAARVSRGGSWAVRYRGTERMDLCTQWVTPKQIDACERISIVEDSLHAHVLVMEYAGRHWRKETRPTRDGVEPDGRPRSRD